MESGCRFSLELLGDIDGRFDLVVANIDANTLIDLAPQLTERLASGGRLVLTGLLTERRDQVIQSYPKLEAAAEQTADDWSCIELDA
jgi:ribosomal protein L11 methyltransferase